MSPPRFLFPLLLAILTATPAIASPWLTYERSTLAKDQYLDGDSFQAVTTTAGKRPYTYIFRLYGADCAETDARYPERLTAQATDFRIPVGDVIGWGEKAKAFTEKFLAKPFTVHTQKVSARGTSKKNRYYAIVIGPDGRDLAEALIRAGLARAFGVLPLVASRHNPVLRPRYLRLLAAGKAKKTRPHAKAHHPRQPTPQKSSIFPCFLRHLLPPSAEQRPHFYSANSGRT